MTLKSTISVVLVAAISVAALFVGTVAFAQETTKVLVQFEGPVQASDKAFVRGLGGEVRHEYSLVPAIAVTIPEHALKGLAHNPRIKAVEADAQVQATVFDDEYRDTWSIGNINAKPVHDGGNTGDGVKIGIIDSGVDYTHPDLAGNYVGGDDFVEGDGDPMDVYGHGTHVAGTACAVMNGVGAVGVAPACDLYALRVLNDAGSGSMSAVIAAVDWAVANDLDVINLSLGTSGDPGSITHAAFDAAYEAGVLIVASAGNSGRRSGRGTNTEYPANYSSVIAVAATDSDNKRASFSSTGDAVELSAPGVAVHSTWNDDTSAFNPQPVCGAYGCYKDGSGTSMASPHVAGVAALVIGKGVQNNKEVRTILQDTASNLGKSTQYGYGLVNAEAATAGIVLSDTPVAHAGPDQAIEVAVGVDSVEVTFDGSASYDQNATGSITTFEWLEAGSVIATGEVATALLTVDTHTITLRVTDNDGNTDEDEVVVDITTYTAPDPSTKFAWGDSVKTQGVLNVRSSPGVTTENYLGQQPRNTTGVVVGGPVYADGYWWWKIDYEVSSIGDVDGWSVENWLRKLKNK